MLTRREFVGGVSAYLAVNFFPKDASSRILYTEKKVPYGLKQVDDLQQVHDIPVFDRGEKALRIATHVLASEYPKFKMRSFLDQKNFYYGELIFVEKGLMYFVTATSDRTRQMSVPDILEIYVRVYQNPSSSEKKGKKSPIIGRLSDEGIDGRCNSITFPSNHPLNKTTKRLNYKVSEGENNVSFEDLKQASEIYGEVLNTIEGVLFPKRR